MQNLVGLIQKPAKYLAKYGAALPVPPLLPYYSANIVVGTTCVALHIALKMHRDSIRDQKVYGEADHSTEKLLQNLRVDTG